jgi:type II secretory pathway component PulF
MQYETRKMPRYQYTAIAADGKRIKGAIAAESPYAARKQLRTRSIHPTSVTEVGSAAEGRISLFSIFGKGRKSQLIDFTKQLATLLESGIKLTESLSVLTLQTSDMRFKNALTDIRDRVVTGESFADAMKDYSDYFDVIYISMVRVGEVTGTLGKSLSTIAGFMEKRQRVESKVMTAMIYPFVLILFCIAAILILNQGYSDHRRADSKSRAGAALDYKTIDGCRLRSDKLGPVAGYRSDSRDCLGTSQVF